MSVVNLGCRLLLAMVFAFAAVSKARGRKSFEEFLQTLGQFGLPKAWGGAPLAAAVVLAEAACALLLLCDSTAGYALALVLLGGFTVGLARVLRRGERIACRCFGASNTPVGAAHLVRNGLLLAVTVLGLAGHAAAPGEPLPAALEVIAGGVGALAGVFVTRWDDLVFLFRGPTPVTAPPKELRRR